MTEEVEETRVNGRLWRTRFDSVGKTYAVTSPEGRVATMTVDAKARPVGLVMPGVAPVAFGYDARGRVTTVTQGARSLTYGYDGNGHLASVRNALNEEGIFTTDSTGRVTKVTQADRKDVLLVQDAVGNLTSVTPADRQAHGFTYSEVNEVTAYTPPAVPGVVAETTTRNLDGHVMKAGHSDGSETTVTRDEYGRVK